jgi:anti-sigma factor RsiW
MPEAESSHTAFETDFSEYYDGSLPEARQREIDAHLAGCERCRSEYERFRGAVGAVSGLGRLRAPRDFDGRVAATIHRRSAGRFFGRRAFGDRIPFEIVAAVALLALVAIYFFFIRWKG